jgi:hypothetical protein
MIASPELVTRRQMITAGPLPLRVQDKETPTESVNQSQDRSRRRLIVCTEVHTGRRVLFVKE